MTERYRQHEVLFCRRQNHETHTGRSKLGGRDSDRKISAAFTPFLPKAKIMRRVMEK